MDTRAVTRMSSKTTATGITRDVLTWLLRWGPALIPVVVLAIACGPFAVSFGRAVIGAYQVEAMAYALIPPEYPGGELISQTKGGGTTTKWDRRVYTVHDSIDDVTQYFADNGIVVKSGGDLATGRSGSICNQSVEAIDGSRFLVGGHYPWYSQDDNLPLPCVSVKLQEDPQAADVTVIEMEISWPAD